MLGQSPVFGAELRRLRMNAGLTLTAFAASVHYSKGQISKVETGRKTPTAEFARLCDNALCADGRLIRLAPPSPPRDEAGERMTGTSVPRDTPSGRPPSRRQVMAMGASAIAVPGHVAGERPEPDLDLDLVSASRGLFDQYRRLGQLSPPGALLPALAEQTRALGELSARCGGRTRAALLRLASRYAEFAGWMAQESGDDGAALRWTDEAVTLAHAAGDQDLSSYALTRKALISYYQGDGVATVQLAEGALGSRLPYRIRAWAAQHVAQGHALAGDMSTCLSHLDQARELFAADQPDPALPLLGATHLNDPVGMITAWCLVDLGAPQRAARALDQLCADISAGASRTQARYGVRRALAHAMAGEPEHACAVARPLLPAARAADSATVRSDLRRLSRTLARFRSCVEVRRLVPDLTAALQPTYPSVHV
ncbi:helix-turn-helix transcriptional regulator [Streptomyces sp. NPDC006422]|uniref:helix-turn-helix transcriptional regulator n=1 Tax=unclassified Streptomyces TaxID=2593676 RepID=UPI0033A5E555